MKGIFAYDGPIITFLTKVGEVLLINFLTIILCIPVITMGAALTSMYYTIVKCVVHDRSSVVREYFRSFKRVFVKSAIVTVLLLVLYFVLWYGRWFAILNESGPLLVMAYNALFVVMTAVAIYIFPVLSRYENKLYVLIKLAFVMSIRYFYLTVLFVVMVIGSVLLVVFNFVPILWATLFPGAMCYAMSFLMEKPLLKYMPPLPPDADDWFHENLKKDKSKNN